MSAVANELIRLLSSDPEGWQQDRYTLRHKTGLEIWMANGIFFLNLHRPHKSRLSLTDKWKLSRALKQWGNRSLILSKLAGAV